LSYLVEAARLIIKEYRETAFLIAGTGPLRNQLVARIKQLGVLTNFRFLGDVKDSLLPTLYNCADVFAFPSIQEGQGIALLEAQATAKPVVAFDVGGVGEAVLDKETGFLTKPGTRELTESILKLLSDRALREKMGRSGREFVSKNLSWEICARKLLAVYTEAAGMNLR
jgi:glycosyltransferase involved in cell wall biosynthesis